ncbi:MAG: PAS domain-containing protein [Acidimicrobiales bacterium]
MTEIRIPTERGHTARTAVDPQRRDHPDNSLLLHTELDDDARMVTTIIGGLTLATVDEIVGCLRTLPLLPDVLDCRYVHAADSEAVDALGHVLSRSTAVIRPSVAMQAVVASDDRYDLTGSDAPSLHRCQTGVAVHDAGLRFVYVNERLASINGFSAERHRNRTCAELLRPSHDTVTPLLQRCLDDRTPIRCIVDTAAESWVCRYIPARHRIDGRERDFVVALVSPPWSAEVSDLSAPGARLIFKRVDRTRRHRRA